MKFGDLEQLLKKTTTLHLSFRTWENKKYTKGLGWLRMVFSLFWEIFKSMNAGRQ